MVSMWCPGCGGKKGPRVCVRLFAMPLTLIFECWLRVASLVGRGWKQPIKNGSLKSNHPGTAFHRLGEKKKSFWWRKKNIKLERCVADMLVASESKEKSRKEIRRKIDLLTLTSTFNTLELDSLKSHISEVSLVFERGCGVERDTLPKTAEGILEQVTQLKKTVQP